MAVVMKADLRMSKMRRRSAEREEIHYGRTTGSPSANSPLTMITLTKPIERKGWRSASVTRSRRTGAGPTDGALVRR